MIDYGFIHRYPATNFHELNLDWILAQMIELRSDMKNFVNQNTIKYADPIQWNITTQYEGNTVVVEPNTGNAYISSQPVPAGVAITNEDYWSVIGNFSAFYENIAASITTNSETGQSSSHAYEVNQLLWVDNKLYEVTRDISIGDPFIMSGDNANISSVDIEEYFNSSYETFKNSVNDTLDNFNDELLSKESIAFGEMSFTRYHYTGYVIDVIKIDNSDPDSHNRPIVKGTNTIKPMSNYAVNTKIAINAGYFTIDGTNQSIGSMISEGNFFQGDILNDPDTCYMAIKNDTGDLDFYPYNTDISTLIDRGYDNVVAARCPFIENGTTSSRLAISRFMQQLIGVDYDSNYYIITTSYYSSLTAESQINWILANIPRIKTVFAVDSGGSAQTYIGGMHVNLDSDITTTGEGRNVTGAIAFPIKEYNDAYAISQAIKFPFNNLSVKKLFDQEDEFTLVENKFTGMYFSVYQVGNIVIINGRIGTLPGYDGNWTPIDMLKPLIPAPDASLQITLNSFNNNTNDGRLSIPFNNNQTSINSNPQVKAPANTTQSTTLYYDFSCTYVTRGNR